jgi:putative ABC transport system permease protein
MGADEGDKKSIIILMSLSGLILVLSGINFINLNTAQASQRAKEVGVRKALGSSKGKLITQFLIEALIIYVIAFVISMVVLELLLPTYGNIWEKKLKYMGFRFIYMRFYCTGFRICFWYYSGALSFRI